MTMSNDRKTERENINTYIKIFTYFIAIFSVIIMIIALSASLNSNSQSQEKEVQNLEGTIKISNNTSLNDENTVDDVIQVPGYPGDFVILTDTKGRSFSSIRIGYFTDTKVMYSISSGYGILTLLVNPDGTPMLYEQHTDN